MLKSDKAIKINPRYDLNTQELSELMQEPLTAPSADTIYNAVKSAFNYGYARGRRATIAEYKNK